MVMDFLNNLAFTLFQEMSEQDILPGLNDVEILNMI